METDRTSISKHHPLIRHLGEADAAQEKAFEERLQILKRGTSSWAGIWSEPDGDEQAFVKCYRSNNPIKRLAARVGWARPDRVYRNTCLVADQVPVAAPLALVRNRRSSNIYSFFKCLPGENFAQCVAERIRDSVKVMRLMCGAGELMAALHRNGWSHGDFKWTNIMVSSRGPEDRDALYLVDLDGVKRLDKRRDGRGRDLARFIVNARDFGLGEDYIEAFIRIYADYMNESEEQTWTEADPIVSKLQRRHKAKYGA